MTLAVDSSVPGLSRWRERIHGWRTALIASPRFQRWAAGSLFTRRIAAKNTRDLFDLCAGFVYSQVLLACVRLRLFEILKDGPQTIDALAPRLSLAPDAALRLVRAAVSLRLARALPGARFGLGDLGAAMLGNPSIAGFIEHHGLLYDDLRDPVALLRGQTQTRMSGYWPYAQASAALDHSEAGAGDAAVAPYSGLMSASQALIAEDILDAYPLAAHQYLVDVGGGEGTFAIAAARRTPGLRVAVFDLPAVAARAEARFKTAGLGGRAAAHGGSFLTDSLPAGADVMSLVRIAHDHNDSSLAALLKGIFNALAPGGTLLLAEPMAGTSGAEPIGDAYFGFYLLAMGSGRVRTSQELQGFMQRAGFADCRESPTRRPLLTRLLIARRKL